MTDLSRTIGDNIDAVYGRSVADRLEQDYAELLVKARDVLSDAKELPSVVESSIDVTAIADVIVKMRDLAGRAESHRKAEKEPYLRDGEAVDAFFFKRAKEPLDLQRKNLQSRLDAYKQRQLAEERARREVEAAAARRAQQEAQRVREEADAAARRARSLESIEQRGAEAARARVEADIAAAKAEETTLATMQKPGRMVGERFEGSARSGRVGMRRVPFVMIEDSALIDLERLRPYLKDEHLQFAVRAWAKATAYAEKMNGVIAEMRDTTDVR